VLLTVILRGWACQAGVIDVMLGTCFADLRFIMRKLIHVDDVQIQQKDLLWRHANNFYQVYRLAYSQPVFGSSDCYDVHRTLVTKRNCVIVLPYDPVLDQVVLLEQVRAAAVYEQVAEPSLIESCAGIIDEGDTPESAARRELAEECGLTGLAWEWVADYWVSPGWTTERATVYCVCVDARQLQTFAGLQEEQETMHVFPVDTDVVFQWLDAGKLDNSGLLISIQWLSRHRAALRERWQALLKR